MKAVALIGPSGSGKTTLAEILIRGLRARGYSVGSVKEIHHPEFTIDADPTKNTARHGRAGSQLVTARALGETDVLYQERQSISRILSYYNHDYVILEGVADCNCARIITGCQKEEVLERLDARVLAISGVISNHRQEPIQGLPVLNALQQPELLIDLVEERAFEPLPDFPGECCSACGHTCEELAGLIVANQARRADCVLAAAAVELKIGGRAISMVPFVQQILRNAVLAIVRELEGYEAGETVEVRLHP